MTIASVGRDGFVENYVLRGGVVGNTKIYFGSAGWRDGKTGSASVCDDAGSDVVNDKVEFDVFDIYFGVEFFCYFVNNIYIYADNLTIVVKLKWCKKGVGLDNIIISFDALNKKECTNRYECYNDNYNIIT